MKNKLDVVKVEEEDGYYPEAESFHQDLYKNAAKSAKHRGRLNYLLAALSCLLVLGFVVLLPLKHVEPYVIKVDSSTGIVEVLSPLKSTNVDPDEAITKYWIHTYVLARERYDSQSFIEDSTVVSKMSSVKVFARYSQENAPQVADSPYKTYGDDASIDIRVSNINFLDNDTAIIRFRRVINKTQARSEAYWSTTLSFKYLLTPQSESDRFINPLGFQVTSYRKDPVVLNNGDLQ